MYERLKDFSTFLKAPIQKDWVQSITQHLDRFQEVRPTCEGGYHRPVVNARFQTEIVTLQRYEEMRDWYVLSILATFLLLGFLHVRCELFSFKLRGMCFCIICRFSVIHWARPMRKSRRSTTEPFLTIRELFDILGRLFKNRYYRSRVAYLINNLG